MSLVTYPISRYGLPGVTSGYTSLSVSSVLVVFAVFSRSRAVQVSLATKCIVSLILMMRLSRLRLFSGIFLYEGICLLLYGEQESSEDHICM